MSLMSKSSSKKKRSVRKYFFRDLQNPTKQPKITASSNSLATLKKNIEKTGKHASKYPKR